MVYSNNSEETTEESSDPDWIVGVASDRVLKYFGISAATMVDYNMGVPVSMGGSWE